VKVYFFAHKITSTLTLPKACNILIVRSKRNSINEADPVRPGVEDAKRRLEMLRDRN
jgi:hypothetical protein